ncbi:MAG: serine/threonine-protein kinase [Nannocystaceae bacterium]
MLACRRVDGRGRHTARCDRPRGRHRDLVLEAVPDRRTLGEGGMGKVFKAFDLFMNRYVALKVMKTDVPESEQRRFRLEARLGGSFTHNNLVRVLDVGTTREHGLFWFAMEFLEGRDISDAVTGGRTVPLHVLCEIFRQVLDALRYVHLRGVVHRDIKPANIFVCRDPHDPELRVVKVLDFGVARDLNDARPDDPTWCSAIRATWRRSRPARASRSTAARTCTRWA